MELLFDPRDPSMREDPYPHYRRLRENEPIHQSPFGYWVLSRYADVEAILRAPGVSSEFHRNPTWAKHRGGPESPIVLSTSKWMLMLDGQAHKRIRNLITKVFTKRAVDGMRPRIATEIDRLLDVVGEGEIDLIDNLALPLPVTVTCELLGVPSVDRDRCREWTDRISRVVDPWVAPETAADINAAEVEFREYIAAQLEIRRDSPRDDILSLLMTAEVDGERLTDEEIVANVLFLFSAGHETTVNLIGNGMLGLLRHPDQLQLLREHPEMIAGAIDEIARYDVPVQIAARMTTADVSVDDVTIPKGAKVMLLFGAASRDPVRYPDPDRLDVTRTDVRTLAFSGGPHYCVGAALGKLETSMVFTELLRRYTTIELSGQDLVWRPNMNFRGLHALALKVAY